MLVPAILYKEKINREMQKYFYTEDMMYETGCLENWIPKIEENPSKENYQYAIVDKNNKLLGFMCYQIDWYVSKAYNFGLFSFDRGNIIIGKDVFYKLEDLINTLHRIEWRAVGGNPACRGYDNFIKRHNGNKYILKDAIKDRNGKYRDDIIYEIVNKE